MNESVLQRSQDTERAVRTVLDEDMEMASMDVLRSGGKQFGISSK